MMIRKAINLLEEIVKEVSADRGLSGRKIVKLVGASGTTIRRMTNS